VCLNISTVINIKILANSNQQTQSYKFTSHIAAFLSVVLITEMLEICIQTSYDQNVQLILKSYLPVVYGTPLSSNSQQLYQYQQKNYLFSPQIIEYKKDYDICL
jgi:4-hydroxy-3-methylbut-2-enyl diphosphate reductase IspH